MTDKATAKGETSLGGSGGMLPRKFLKIAMQIEPFYSIWARIHYFFLARDKRPALFFFFHYADLPTCTDFRGTYRFRPSITISRFHAVVYRFWKMREFLGLANFVLSCFRRYSEILSASCTYRQSRRCVAAINSPPGAMSQC